MSSTGIEVIDRVMMVKPSPSLPPFRRLRWKLTLSYTLVTVAALIVLEIVFIFGLAFNLAQETKVKPELLFKDLKNHYAPLIGTYLSEEPPDIDGLREHLAQFEANETDTEPILVGNFFLGAYTTNISYVIFLTADGELIDTLPHNFLEKTKPGEPLDVSEIQGLDVPLEAALKGETDYQNLYTFGAKNRMVGAVPAFDEQVQVITEVAPILEEKDQGQVVGAVAFMQKTGFWEVWTISEIAGQVLGSLLYITAFAAVLGGVFGSLTGRGLVQRLKRLFFSTNAWSKGDFSVFIDDPTVDELGRLAQGLNHMAARMENLLEERQQMSVMQERNRLARDLHDSVKQQTFAASAQLGAALSRFLPDPREAKIHLLEAERLLYDVRQELTDLILELRPIALQGRGLATAVREFARDCKNQSGVDIEVQIIGERELLFEIEQALFRILQSALANVIRHSRASWAKIKLTYGIEEVSLTITDNGRGFNIQKQHNGLGLHSMRERAELINGELQIKSQIGKGTQIAVRCLYGLVLEPTSVRM